MPNAKISPRAKRVWERLMNWYGTRLAEQYGAVPTSDWCSVVDESDNDTVVKVLAQIREKHTTHPPTFPEFELLFRRAKSHAVQGPSLASSLSDYVLRTQRLTDTQLRTPWMYTRNVDGNISGVIVQADGAAPAIRITVADMQLGNLS